MPSQEQPRHLHQARPPRRLPAVLPLHRRGAARVRLPPRHRLQRWQRQRRGRRVQRPGGGARVQGLLRGLRLQAVTCTKPQHSIPINPPLIRTRCDCAVWQSSTRPSWSGTGSPAAGTRTPRECGAGCRARRADGWAAPAGTPSRAGR